VSGYPIRRRARAQVELLAHIEQIAEADLDAALRLADAVEEDLAGVAEIELHQKIGIRRRGGRHKACLAHLIGYENGIGLKFQAIRERRISRLHIEGLAGGRRHLLKLCTRASNGVVQALSDATAASANTSFPFKSRPNPCISNLASDTILSMFR